MYALERTPEYRAWERSLKDSGLKALILARLARLEFGHFGDCKAVGDGLLELRIFAGPGYRIYFCIMPGRIIVLLCGGDKGSQQRDITKARHLKKELDA